MTLNNFEWSNHAEIRFKERFAGINRDLDLCSVKRISQKQKKLIKSICPKSYERFFIGRAYKGRYIMVSRSLICYVIAGDTSRIITVFHLYGDGKI